MKKARRDGRRVSLCLLLIVTACRSIPGGTLVSGVLPIGSGSGRITQHELRDALVQYASRCEATIVAAADTIAAGTKDPLVQRRALRWKLGVIPVMNQAAFLPEPEDAYVAMLTIATSLRDYLSTGAGAQVLGDQQSLAVDASNDLVDAAVALGERFLSEKEIARVTGEVEALVRSRPIRGEFVAEQIQRLVTTTETSAVFDWVTAIPLSPFRALQGVDQGAQAIREFNDTALEFSRIVATMPRLVRWNLSALLDEAERTGQSLGPLADSLERTAAAVGAAGTAWGALVAELSKPPADAKQPSRPFDIREWEQTAARIGTAATELRTLVDSLHTLAGSDALGPPLAEIDRRAERIEASSRSLVDLAAWRGLELILAFFVLLFVYRRVEAWLARRSTDTLRGPIPRDRA
jgi:hypothetical protein